MVSLYDKIKKKSDKDALQNRINRVTRKAKEFNGGKYNATHKSYIKGDVKSSASTRAYGYKKYGIPEHTNFTGGRNKYRYAKLQKGENPYEAKYLWTGKKSYVPGGKREDGSKYEGFMSKTRQLTDDEKKAYKATGDIDVEAYDRAHNYSFWRSYNKDAKTFDEHSNLTKDGKFLWDGMEVARNKVNNGGSKFNYLGGFLKDIIIDPLREGIRHVDKLSSAGMGAIAGGIEESANLFEAIADPNIKIKDNVNFNRSKENFLKSIEQSNKEGWGRGMGEYFDDAHERNVAKEINRLKNSSDYTEEHKKKLIEELENSRTDGTHKAFRSISGFAGDVAAPFDLGGAVVDILKNGGKATLKSGKELLNGTADVTTAFRVDGGKTQAMLDKFAKRMEGVKASKKGETIDVLTGNQEPFESHKIINSLNNEYERVMSKTDNIVKEVKSNPSTENLGSFLEAIGKSDKGVQKHIDGRTLNKKYTQTRDGYVPKLFAVDDVIEHTPNVDKNQMSFFNRNGNTNTYMKNITPNTRKYEQWYDAYNGNEDMLFDMIDGLSDSNSDSMLDWLKNRDPLAYKKYMSGADTIDDFADTGVNVNKIKSKAYDKQIKEITSIKPRNNIKFDVAKTDAMKEENAIEKLVKLFSDEATPNTYKNSIERNKAFREYVGQFSDDLFNGKVDIDDLSNTIKQVRGKDVPAKVKREFINNKLFGGNNVIASSVSNSSIDAFLESLEDISNLKRVANEYMKTGEILPVQLSSATKKFLNIGDDLKIKGGKVRGDKIDSPEDLLITLTNSIYDRSRALTDERYGEKLQLMAKVFGYEYYYRDVVNKLDDLTSELKSLDKLPITKENLSRKLELSENIKRLKQVKADRTKMWESIKNLPESNFDKYISEVYPQHMKDMNAYSPRANQTKELDNMAKGSDNVLNDVYNKMFDEKVEKRRSAVPNLIEESRKAKFETTNKHYNNIGETNVIDTAKKFVDKHTLQKAIDYKNKMKEVKRISEYREKVVIFTKERGLKLPEKTNAKVKLAKNQTLGSLPPVKNNLDNLKKLIKKEVEEMYTNPELYAKNESMYDAIKRDYINGLRSYGVPDNAYFEKATNLRKLAEESFEKDGYVKVSKKADEVLTPADLIRQAERDELLKKSSYKEMSDKEIFERKLNKGKEGGSGTPKDGMKMNLQLLASKIDEMFDELGKADIDSLFKFQNKIEEPTYLNDFDRFNQEENAKLLKKNKDKFSQKEKESLKPPIEEIEKRIKTIEDTYGDRATMVKKSLDDDYVPSRGYNVDMETGEVLKTSLDKIKNKDKKPKDNSMPYDDNILYDTYKRWLNSLKKGLTVYNPGWHVQNFFQNKGQNYLGLGTDAFKSQKEAREMLKAIKGEPNKAKTILNKHGIAYTPEDITKLVQDLNVVDGLGNDVRQARGIFSDLETKVDNSGIMQFLNKNEETARLHHFMTKLKRGSTPEEALKSVNKYLFDYSKQNKFDRAMNDFVDPFWTFHKNNARLLTTQAIENPDKIGAIQRGIRGLQNDVDEQDKAYPQYRSIQSPVGQFTDSKNKDKYNYQYDLNLFPEFEKAIPLDKDGLMTKVNPLIKLAYQQANGVGEFDNKIVDKDVSKFGEVTKDENTLDMLLTINPFMNPLFKTFDKTSNHQDKVKEGKQTQETTDKQIMMEWLAYIFGNKGNYYRDLR